MLGKNNNLLRLKNKRFAIKNGGQTTRLGYDRTNILNISILSCRWWTFWLEGLIASVIKSHTQEHASSGNNMPFFFSLLFELRDHECDEITCWRRRSSNLNKLRILALMDWMRPFGSRRRCPWRRCFQEEMFQEPNHRNGKTPSILRLAGNAVNSQRFSSPCDISEYEFFEQLSL